MSALKSNVLVPLSSLSFTQWAIFLLCDNTLDSSFLSAPTLNCHTSLEQREVYWWTVEHSRSDASMESTPSLALTWFERRVSGSETHNMVSYIASLIPSLVHGILRVIHSSLFNPFSLWLHFTKRRKVLSYCIHSTLQRLIGLEAWCNFFNQNCMFNGSHKLFFFVLVCEPMIKSRSWWL